MKTLGKKLAQLRCYRYLRILSKEEVSMMMSDFFSCDIKPGMLNKIESESYTFSKLDTIKKFADLYGLGLDYMCEDRPNYNSCTFAIPKVKLENKYLVPHFSDDCRVVRLNKGIVLNLVQYGENGDMFLVNKNALPEFEFGKAQDAFCKRVGAVPFPDFDVEDVLKVIDDPELLICNGAREKLVVKPYSDPVVKNIIDDGFYKAMMGFKIPEGFLKGIGAKKFLALLSRD